MPTGLCWSPSSFDKGNSDHPFLKNEDRRFWRLCQNLFWCELPTWTGFLSSFFIKSAVSHEDAGTIFTVNQKKAWFTQVLVQSNVRFNLKHCHKFSCFPFFQVNYPCSAYFLYWTCSMTRNRTVIINVKLFSIIKTFAKKSISLKI